jgi:hypothetical protein
MKLARQRWQDAVQNFIQGVDSLNTSINEFCSRDIPPGNMQRGKEITRKVEELKNMFSAAAFDKSVDQLLKKDDVGNIHKKEREQGLAVLRRYVDKINDPLIQAVVNDQNPFGRLNVQISALNSALKSLQLALLVNG